MQHLRSDDEVLYLKEIEEIHMGEIEPDEHTHPWAVRGFYNASM